MLTALSWLPPAPHDFREAARALKGDIAAGSDMGGVWQRLRSLALHALDEVHLPSLRIEDTVSQADIAALAAYVIDLPDSRWMGQNLLRRGRNLPVLSDLEEQVFDHGTNRLFSHNELVNADASSLPPNEAKALLYYRAFLEFINQAK